MTRTLVVVPTYDEREALPTTLLQLRATVPSVDILVVDASPDGTGAIADAIAAQDPAVHVLHRTGKLGLGTAYVAGSGWALDRGYDVVVEMDADGSHRAVDPPALLDALADADLVLGSRWVDGGRQLAAAPAVAVPRRQRVHAAGTGTAPARLDRGLRCVPGGRPAADPPGGRVVAGLLLPGRHGPARRRGGHRVVEAPITFVERVEGRSTMSRAIVLEALVRVTGWAVRRRMPQGAGAMHRLLAGRRVRPE